MRRFAPIVLVLTLACGGHHAPPATEPTAAASPAPPAYADTTAAWAGLHHRPDSAAQPATAPSAPTPKADTVNQWMAANLAIGDDGVFIVRAHYGGRVYVGAGNATQTITMQVDAGAIDDFVAETRDWLPPKKPRRDAPPPVLQEAKSGRAISFGRHIYGGQPHYRFFFSDDRGGGFSLQATLTEARAMLNGLARGATLAREAQPRP